MQTVRGERTTSATLSALGTRALRFLHLVLRPVRRAAGFVMARPVWNVIGVLLIAQWATIGIVAAIARHNGVYYYTGGDSSWYYTTAWTVAHGHIPQALIGYGYPMLLAPVAYVAGPSMLAGLPFVIALNLLVLWPIALLCVYGIAKAIGGRGFAYLTTLGWVVFPLASIPYFYANYHERYVDQSLPAALGLVVTGDFPSMVALLVAAYFALQALERNPRAAVLAGLAVGIAATVKPANLIFLPAPIAAFLVTRRFREILLFGVAVMPAIAGLTLWKYRGLGYVPAFGSAPNALASGLLTPPAVGGVNTHKYVQIDWQHLWHNALDIREYTWSLRMVTWVLVAGAIGLVRRSAAVGILIGGWLASFIVFKGASPGVNIKSGSAFRYLVPAFPPFFLGLAAIVLLVPVFGRRLALAGRRETYWPDRRRAWIALFAVAGVATVAPVLAIAAFHPLRAPRAAEVATLDQYAPAGTFKLAARVEGDGSVVLSWPAQGGQGARVSYIVLRTHDDSLACSPVPHGASQCLYYTNQDRHVLVPLAHTFIPRFRDHPPPSEPWVYRVAVLVAPWPPAGGGDFLQISAPTETIVVQPF
jgi:hypothetical protein